MLEVEVLKEAGYEQAVKGLSLSHRLRFVDSADVARLEKVAYNLCDKDGGHNKFLESMMIWAEIKAPRYWWQDFDTYRVGMTKQSESTIHTIMKRRLVQEDFVEPIPDLWLSYLNTLIDDYSVGKSKKLFRTVKNLLPEGYLQKRIACFNYKCFRNIMHQRKGHALKEWEIFIKDTLKQLEHAELLTKDYDYEN